MPPKPTPKPLSPIEIAQAALDSLVASNRDKRRQVEILNWELREELPIKINAARAALAAAQAQPQKDEFRALADALGSRDRELAALARTRMHKPWEPRV
jgi:hypothetical protein